VLAAVANMAIGRGTEEVEKYRNTELIYCGIDNMPTMRSSREAFCQAIYNNQDAGSGLDCLTSNSTAGNGATGTSSSSTNPGEGYWRRIDNSSWITHCSTMLTAAVLAATKIHLEGSSILVHCSDGWDRTAQICSTAQILLDPYYRTLEGFFTLVEKDWCSFGHKFDDRCGHAESPVILPEERSPIFVQWLDVLQSIMIQFDSQEESHFEYNSYLLLFVADHVYSGLFGNFLGNSEFVRAHRYSVRSRTQSIWSYILENRSTFINNNYKELPYPIWPSCSVESLELWKRYYYRWDCSSHPKSLVAAKEWHDDW
jgi:hypothetical protein